MMDMTEDQIAAVEKVRKLLALADRAGTPEEAASAAAKAQELLEAYNLEMGAVEQAQGVASGRREEMKQRGGMFLYERQLWNQVAQLNFCLYYYGRERYWRKDLQRDAYRFHHEIIGRTVNVAATRALGSYLQGAIERLCRERLHERGEGNAQFFSSWAVSFREGAADDIIWRIYDRRQQKLKDEEAKRREDAERSAMAGTSTATALTLQGFTESEKDANLDFIHGEGYSARRRERQARQAAADAAAEAQYTAWAAAHPEEARKEEAKREKLRLKAENRREGRQRNKNWGAYRAGAEAAKNISIDPQVGTPDRKRITHA